MHEKFLLFEKNYLFFVKNKMYEKNRLQCQKQLSYTLRHNFRLKAPKCNNSTLLNSIVFITRISLSSTKKY